MKWIAFFLCVAVLGFFTMYSRNEIPQIPLDGVPISSVVEHEDLVTAIIHRNEKAIEQCLKKGADPNSKNQHGDTALMWAVNNGDEGLVQTLLARGADPQIAGSYGYQPLHWSSKKGFIPTTRLLLNHGVDIDVPDQNGNTALILASGENHGDLVQYLLAKGADPNGSNLRGETALLVAVDRSAKDVVELLVLAGADPERGAESGQTPLTLAVVRESSRLFLTDGILKKYPDMKERLRSLVKVEVINASEKPSYNLEEMAVMIHDLVNRERKAMGLNAIAFDEELAKLALGHSKDMGTADFFNHINPNRDGPSERALRAGLSIKRKNSKGAMQTGIGENIYMSAVLTGTNGYLKAGVQYMTYNWLQPETLARMAVQGWMDSPGHRANILQPEYIREGLGLYLNADNELYITQNFQ